MARASAYRGAVPADTTTSPESKGGAPAPHVGRILGGRYALIARVGAGSSATVWRARDSSLDRDVALKTLHPGLSGDEGFLSRFRSEAKSAASVSHNHLLAVHDWGEDDGQPYLVTELLEGGSLRALLDQGLVLTPSQTIRIGLEACRGLHHAHSAGLVHRDIKPANLLFGRDGHLRVADFGLARALADAGWTDPSGNELSGTARYASPEQALGHRLSAVSDVYSLGLVLIESLTGSVPFASDTIGGALAARIDNDVPIPDVPDKLADALRAMTRRMPDERLSAAKAGVALLQAADGLPRPQALPLAGLPRPSAVADAAARTQLAPLPEQTQVAPTRAGEAGDGPERRWPWLLVVTAFLAAAAWFAFTQIDTSAPALATVPDVVGLDRTAALAELGAPWVLEEKFDRVDGVATGLVIRTDPPAGETLAEGESLSYWLSLGPPLVRVPVDDMVGRSQEQAALTLEDLGLVVGEVTRVNDETVGAGLVMAVESSSPELIAGASVDLVVSSGPSLRQVLQPVAGALPETYVADLQGLGLGVDFVEEFNEEVDAGGFISIEPAPGTPIERGGQVRVVVSLGPEPVPVPDTSGQSLGDAIDEIEALGFLPGELLGSNNGRCSVVGTDPPAGTPLQPGNPIDIVLSDCGLGED